MKDSAPLSNGGQPVAVSMAGGRGSRLRPLTDCTPKPLLSIGDERIIEGTLRRLARAGIVDVWLTLHYLAEQFGEALGGGEQFGLRLHYLHEEVPLGTAGGLRMIPVDVLSGPIVVTNGDLVTDLDFSDLVEAHRTAGSLLTVVGVEHYWSCVYGVLRTCGNRLVRIDEKPGHTDTVNAGMYVVSPELLADLPADGPLGMPEVIDIALQHPNGIHVYKFEGVWNDVGSHDELERLRLDYCERSGAATDSSQTREARKVI